ncbi:MAG: hypothetical protein ACJ762_06520 [Solirubrobacteraceae bacterium]
MRPTPKQLAFLRTLAARTGETFTYPQTAAQASAEIDRLKQRRPSSRIEQRLDRDAISTALADRPHDATRIREDETTGHGSTAAWTDKPWEHDDYQVGKRTELGRYRISIGERIVFGQRVDGVVRVTDRPATGAGRSYLVDRGLTSKAELDALVADYIEVSVRRDKPGVLVDLAAAAVAPPPEIPISARETAHV